jgi:hypothetical protein
LYAAVGSALFVALTVALVVCVCRARKRDKQDLDYFIEQVTLAGASNLPASSVLRKAPSTIPEDENASYASRSSISTQNLSDMSDATPPLALERSFSFDSYSESSVSDSREEKERSRVSRFSYSQASQSRDEADDSISARPSFDAGKSVTSWLDNRIIPSNIWSISLFTQLETCKYLSYHL